MTYSIDFPIKTEPSLTDIRLSIKSVIEELNLNVELVVSQLDESSFSIYESNLHEYYVFDYIYFSPDLREFSQFPFMGCIETRSNTFLAGVIAYAIAKIVGEYILNDSGIKLGENEVYDLQEFKKVLNEEIIKFKGI